MFAIKTKISYGFFSEMSLSKYIDSHLPTLVLSGLVQLEDVCIKVSVLLPDYDLDRHQTQRLCMCRNLEVKQPGEKGTLKTKIMNV